MREYYARLFREARVQVFVFWKAQVAVSIGAGILSTVANSIRQQSPLGVALWTVGMATVGYLVMLAFFSVCAMMVAPVTLDRRRVEEVEQARAIASERGTEISALRQSLSQKHPADEHQERIATEALRDFAPDQIKFVKWMLLHGEVPDHKLQESGIDQLTINDTLYKGRKRLLFNDRRDPRGTIHTKINDELKSILRDILYPPDRPVTPPQS